MLARLAQGRPTGGAPAGRTGWWRRRRWCGGRCCGARRHFVHHQLTPADEELDGGADETQALGDAFSAGLGRILLAGGGAGRGDGDVEDAG